MPEVQSRSPGYGGGERRHHLASHLLGPPVNRQRADIRMSSFATYLIGFIVIVVGLAIAAYLLNVPTTWIAVGVLIMVGVGIVMATSRTKPRDPPSTC